LDIAELVKHTSPITHSEHLAEFIRVGQNKQTKMEQVGRVWNTTKLEAKTEIDKSSAIAEMTVHNIAQIEQ